MTSVHTTIYAQILTDENSVLVFISEECEGPLCAGMAMKDWRELFENYCEWEDTQAK